MIRRTTALAAATVAALATGASPASAAPRVFASGCAANHVCLWEDNNYGGDRYVDYARGSNPGDRFNIDGWNGDNEISSAKNNTALVLVLWDNDNYTGTRACVNPNSWSSNLDVTNNFDNDAESFQLRTFC